MSDEFKQKLEAYEKGELSEEDLNEFEEELAKLEDYQTVLEQESDQAPESNLNTKKQQKMMFKGKWKARLQTAFTALGIIILFTIVSSVLTAIYYSWGSPDRVDVYREIIDHTLTITDPYGSYGGTNTHTKPYFGLGATRNLNKRVGRDTIKVGEMEVNFLFSMMGYPDRTYVGRETQSRPHFFHPTSSEPSMSDWNQLEKLPEGTVASAYVSFEQLLETRTVIELFSEKEMNLLWLAVDTGVPLEDDFGMIFDPIGFPNMPIWHEDDMIIQSQEIEEGWFGSRVVSESSISPDYSGSDQDVFHDQFLKTLSFLKEHQNKASRLIFGGIDIEEKLNYIENNGILHYGAVITGPTKEILSLQDEPSIVQLEVDEVEFWNWD